jgi:hypothetical protein
MNLTMFVAAMLGHFVGDYLFQSQWMATEKSYPGIRGHKACTIHVLLYTFAVALFTGWHPLFLLAVAAPHWLIDRWSLAKYWLRYKNGYDAFKGVWEKAPVCAVPAPDLLERNVWKVAFAAPVYIMNDNTLHWVCLWFTVKYLLG